MAQTISIWQATYSDVGGVYLPKQGGGTALFVDTSDADATTDDILEGKTAYVNGVKLTGTGQGGGGGPLYVFSLPTYLNEDAAVGGQTMTSYAAFGSDLLVAGATVKFLTYNDYILETVTGMTTGNVIPFVTVQRGTYTFTMPNESVYCDLRWDD